MGIATRNGMSSPRSMDGTASPRTPSALRNELAAAKKAVEVLKAEKQNAEENSRNSMPYSRRRETRCEKCFLQLD